MGEATDEAVEPATAGRDGRRTAPSPGEGEGKGRSGLHLQPRAEAGRGGAARAPGRCGNGVAVAGFTMSTVALVFVLPGVGLVLSIISGAMSGVGVYKSKRGAPHGGLAVAGLTISIVALLVSIIVTVAFAYFWSDLVDWLEDYEGR